MTGGTPPATVVELCGPPGCGKTTLTAALCAELHLQGVPAVDAGLPAGAGRARTRRLAGKATAVTGQAAFDPTSAVAVARAVHASGLGHREQLARAVNLLVLRHRVRRPSRQGGVVVFDQGYVQELVSIAMTGDPAPALEVVARRAPSRSVLVRVDLPAATLVERLARRSGTQSRVERLGATALAAELERIEGLLDEVTERWVAATGAELVRVGGDDPDAAAALTRLLGGSPSTSPPPPSTRSGRS